ncbi:hypothetical protein J4050_01330 [Winogradskyella sp. DF17]|uniref:Uncharacterized protein n=1 Tax=Winogradskyella pelagia TaxID=2819984 RepID=A0ABS3SXZ7_9FLAO|nr:hypothetical protein [Winogradskyella sp. DF17]MBO3115367.1 hypothetical protein [Winogradskyella sp. DF17]
MKPAIKNTLPCTVFGHNYVISGLRQNNPVSLACKECGSPLNTDDNGNFTENGITNKAIQTTLRQLFHLRLKLSMYSY